MKKVLAIIILGIIIVAPSCVNNFRSGVRGNGILKSEEIPLTDYNEINLYSIGDIVYEQKDSEPYLRLEIDENLVEFIKISVEDNILSIKTSKEINPLKGCKIYTNSKQLIGIRMSGVGKAELIGNIKGESLSVENTGVSSINGMNLDYQNISVRNSGVGNITLGGKTVNLSTNLSGVGSINVRDMETENIETNNSGVGTTRVKK